MADNSNSGFDKDGIKDCNDVENSVGPLLTVEELKAKWLFGVVPIIDENGNELSDDTLQTFINTAISMIEHDLDISLVPRTITEQKDYFENDYYDWGYFHVNNIPVIDIKKIEVVYLLDPVDPNDDDSPTVPEAVLKIPRNWIRLRRIDGEIRLIPNNKFPASLQIDSGGAFFPELFRRHGMVPQLWWITYTFGFENGKVPTMVNAAIGMLAAQMAMNIAGDLKLGTGIAALSLDLDGMSQAINSTASAENHTYSAKVKELGRLLNGDPGDKGQPGILQILRNYYRGTTLNII